MRGGLGTIGVIQKVELVMKKLTNIIQFINSDHVFLVKGVLKQRLEIHFQWQNISVMVFT